MNLDELQSVQSRERQASSLQHLRASFYREAGEFVRDLRERRDEAAAAADDPFDSDEVRRLTDDIKTAERTVEAIYERRVGKVVKMASIAAADMPYDDDGLTHEEEALFETLVGAIEENRETVLSVLDGDVPGLTCRRTDGTEQAPPGTDPTEPETRPATDTGATTDTSVADEGGAPVADPPDAPPTGAGPDADDGLDIGGAMGGGPSGSGESGATSPGPDGTQPASGEGTRPAAREPAPDTAAAAGAGTPDESGGAGATEDESVSRRVVRITGEVGDIFGVDGRTYDLSADDVVDLPEENAEILVEQENAEPVD